MKLKFDLNNHVETPELILGTRNYDKLGAIVHFDNLSYDYNLMAPDSISFTVYKEFNHETERLWDEIKERKLIYLKDFDEWFQIDVVTNEENGIRKEITGTSLCEAELSQIYLKSTEINTENDIARDDYQNPTVFYRPSNPKESLLDRLLKDVPHYSIRHVDESLYSIQRMFRFDGTTIYDALTGEIAEEIGCLFLFDSTDRSISVYDLQTNCRHCGHRGEDTDICPECGSTDLKAGYGTDTTIFVDSETLAENISLSGKQDEVKNYLKVCGGDEIMDAAISASNPTGTQYIYAFSRRDKEDMTEELCSGLEEYSAECERLTPSYQDIMEHYYNALDEQLQLESGMMPDIETAQTTAQQELAKLTASNLSPIAVQDVSLASVYTVNNAVLGMAKCLVNSTVYNIALINGSTSLESQTWRGKFRLENRSDTKDSAENTGYVTLTINDDYENYIEQKIRKTIDRDDPYLVDIFDLRTELSVFQEELKKYCLNRLTSFESAYQSIIDVLIEANCANDSTYGALYQDLYLPYYQKLTAIQKEANIRDAEIKAVNTRLEELEDARLEITSYLNLEHFLGETLWEELCSFRREDSFENSNYISDGLTNREVLAKAHELLEKAKKEAITASTLQLSLSASLLNLLAIPEFQKLTGMFEGGNWIRVGLDHQIYRLRLIHYQLHFSEIQNLEVEFSDVTQTANGLSDTKSLMDQVSSMAANFNYIAHQAEQGAKSFSAMDQIRNEGLSAALYHISNSANQEFVLDEHGITGRQWDDILGNYLPEQIKLTSNLLVYTDDYWETAKAALGKIEYYHPIRQETQQKYGLLADAVISGILMGNDIIGGNLYSENYSSASGTYLNLNDGSFRFGGGKFSYDAPDNRMTMRGVTIEWDTTTTPEITDINGLTDRLVQLDENIDTSFQNLDDKMTRILSGTYLTSIGENYIISPYIGGGYLHITGSGGSVIIDPKKIKNSSYIFGVYNPSGSLVMGVDTSGNGMFHGRVTTENINATGGTIGGWTITSGKIYAGDKTTGVAVMQYPQDSINWVFAAGGTSHSSYADCPFRVSKAGALYAENATIEGKIKATDGTIGGWTIGTSSIYRNSSVFGASNGMYLGTNGLSIGSNFKITPGGTVTANGSFSTGTSGTYAVLNDYGLRFYRDNVPYAYFNSSGFVGSSYYGVTVHSEYASKFISFGNKDTANATEYSTKFLINYGLNPNGKTQGVLVYSDLYVGGDISCYDVILRNTYGNVTMDATYVSNDWVALKADSFYTSGNLYVGGDKNRVVDTKHYGTVCLSAYETATPYFGDIGSGTCSDDGLCYVYMDDIFRETVILDCKYYVFLQSVGESTVFLLEQNPDYFVVKGLPNQEFYFEIKCRQKGTESNRLDNIYFEESEAITE